MQNANNIYKNSCILQLIMLNGVMKNIIKETFPKKETEEMLFRALGALYSFECIEVEEFGLAFQQIYLLKILRRNTSLKMSEIVSVMKLRAFGATRLIDQLVKLGYVLREIVENDRRGRVITITSEGMAVVKKIEAHAYKLITPLLAELNGEELAGLINTIEKFGKISGVN